MRRGGLNHQARRLALQCNALFLIQYKLGRLMGRENSGRQGWAARF
jgi:hypothetical protein